MNSGLLAESRCRDSEKKGQKKCGIYYLTFGRNAFETDQIKHDPTELLSIYQTDK
jgi:hypothetical protein